MKVRGDPWVSKLRVPEGGEGPSSGKGYFKKKGGDGGLNRQTNRAKNFNQMRSKENWGFESY